jgi:hypothetical protein
VKIIMRKLMVLIIAGIVCAMLLAAGCTSSPATTPATPAAVTTAEPVTTTAATTVSTTAATELNVTAVTTTAAPASWNGTWNTTYSSKGSADVIEMLTLTQAGSSVTGSYGHGNGTISATEQGGKIAGTWNETDDKGVYSGFFVFEKAADDKSFKGLWVNTADGENALKNTTQYWNGVRV